MCFSDKFHVQLLYERICGPTKYVCVCIVNYECQLHQKSSLCFGELTPCNTFLVFLEIKTDYGKGQACLALKISWYATDYQRAET
jgi:hypothetical protein